MKASKRGRGGKCGKVWCNSLRHPTLLAPRAGRGRPRPSRGPGTPSQMLRFLLTRLSLVIPTFIGMTLLAFFLIRLVPGDPIETMAGERGIDAARHAALLKEYGLDRPVLVQYGIYIGRVLHGDLGKSMITQEPVLQRVPGAVPGDHRARRLRDPVRARHRHSRRHDRRGAAQLGVRPRRDGRLAHRLLDADLLVGAAADPALLGAARLDAGVRAASRCKYYIEPVTGLPHDRLAAVRREGRVQVGACRT